MYRVRNSPTINNASLHVQLMKCLLSKKITKLTFNLRKSVSSSKLLLCCLSNRSSNCNFISDIVRLLYITVTVYNPGAVSANWKKILLRLIFSDTGIYSHLSSGTSDSIMIPSWVSFEWLNLNGPFFLVSFFCLLSLVVVVVQSTN